METFSSVCYRLGCGNCAVLPRASPCKPSTLAGLLYLCIVLSPAYILHTLHTECGYNPGDSILVGVSGGADSVALLHLLHTANVPVAAAHVNYGLRDDESNGDEQFVSELCAQLNVPLYIRKTTREELATFDNNLQAAARKLRNNFFEEIAAKEAMGWTALAHHSNDQLETVLMNFLRGSGLNGMTGMRYVNGTIVRPLLDVPREAVLDYLRSNGLQWREDSSNAGDDYLRNRVRHHVMPELQSLDQRNARGWKNSIAQLDETHQLLEALLQPHLAACVTEANDHVRIDKEYVRGFSSPALLFNYLLNRYAFSMHFSDGQFAQLLAQQAGKKYESGALVLTVDRGYFVLGKKTIGMPAEQTLHPGETTGAWSCAVVPVAGPLKVNGYEAFLNGDLIDAAMIVRAWRAGDRVQPVGLNGTKKVSDALTELKVPSHEKAAYPVLVFRNEIVWIPGYRIAEKYKITDHTKTALHIRWNR